MNKDKSEEATTSLKRACLDLRNSGPPASITRGVLQQNVVKVSFIEERFSFTNVDWIGISKQFSNSTEEWDFLAFGANHKSALISVHSADAGKKLQQIKSINNTDEVINILIEPSKASKKRGIIFNRFLSAIPQEDLRLALEESGITEYHRIEKLNSVTGNKFFTGSIIIVFDKDEIVENIKIAKVSIPVNLLKPRPMLCTICGLLGHTFKRCKNDSSSICNRCFHNHSPNSECIIKCINCNQTHLSSSKDCEAFNKEIRILTLKEDLNLNYHDAKSMAENTLGFNINEETKKMNESSKQINKLIAKNSKLVSELRLAHDEKENLTTRIIEYEEVIIPSFAEKLDNYKKENELTIQKLQDSIKAHMDETFVKHEKLKNEYESLRIEKETISNKLMTSERNSQNYLTFFHKFLDFSPTVKNAFYEYKKLNKEDPFIQSGLVRRNSVVRDHKLINGKN